ncbi:glycosyltransferase [Luedemannella helvata]|uniref:glycosyltransferase n=1 Tax=Luedemannella helvata TaxID=349315 RepID=UPI0031D3C49D
MTAPMRRVLMTCGVFEPGHRGGGLVPAVAGIIDTVPDDVEVHFVTLDRDLGDSRPYPGLAGRWSRRGRARVFYLTAASPSQWWRLLVELRRRPYDVVHVNSVLAPLSVAFLLATRLRLIRGRTILISPHGELAPGALALKATKKRVYLRCLPALLGGADVTWHATTVHEAAQVRAAVPAARVVVCENRVRLSTRARPPAADPCAVARLVFVSRIAPVKDLGLALRALAAATVPVGLDVYGPIEDPAYWAQCEALIARLPPHVTARYGGEVPPGGAVDVFGGYDAFVFPTHGENFGYVIAESLAASCPVVCSAATPWTPVLEAGGGVVVAERSPRAWAAALNAVAASSPAERAAARARAGAAYEAWRAGRGEESLYARRPAGRVAVGSGGRGDHT